MIQHNPEIEVIIANATEQARKYDHEYVTLEHLAHGLMTFKPWAELMLAFGVDVDAMVNDIEEYLQKQTYIISKQTDYVPKKTHSLERVFNRAFTQVLFSAREQMETIDLFLSISQEPNSHAAYFLLKWGINRRQIGRAHV